MPFTETTFPQSDDVTDATTSKHAELLRLARMLLPGGPHKVTLTPLSREIAAAIDDSLPSVPASGPHSLLVAARDALISRYDLVTAAQAGSVAAQIDEYFKRN